jgi:hypothetical protein
MGVAIEGHRPAAPAGSEPGLARSEGLRHARVARPIATAVVHDAFVVGQAHLDEQRRATFDEREQATSLAAQREQLLVQLVGGRSLGV